MNQFFMKNRYQIILITVLLLFICTGCVSGNQKNTETEVEIPQVELEPSQWQVTQYGDADTLNEMFYTIENDKGELVIIDGGYTYHADRVRMVIKEHGNHVTAWIISHPHPDHAGAFNVIMEEKDDIVVDDIYTIDMNYELYEKTAQDYDDFSTAKTFREVISGLDNVHLVHENDTFHLIGLDFLVLYAWNDEVEQLEDHQCNNGSMMFKVSGTSMSMLFCADVQKEVQKYIIKRHKDELDVDYVQLGHHGNWGLTKKFYKYTKPKQVLFDSNDQIFVMEGTSFNADKLREYFDSEGVEWVNFSTAPNTVILE
ncbi:MAG: MBL fold metallo-hydrolase [Clostridium sp.]|nr:MBL fold metallo-hydrolase [Clostridium sp.]MCM1398123.1 MBL fold metallo-hydrolase [Clostridium sp.]MCM1460875.1 MBL fold metallo-hydrolase [Bacteroides sp.]